MVIGFILFHRIWGVSELPTSHQRWPGFLPQIWLSFIKILLNLSNSINVSYIGWFIGIDKCPFTNKYDSNCVVN